MRNYQEAQTLAAAHVTEIAGYAGGRTRRIAFETRADGSVAARMFATDVVTFHPDHVVVRMGGYVTPSTFDGIAAALNVTRAVVGTCKRIPYLAGKVLDPNGENVFGYDLATEPYDGEPVTA